MNAVVPGLRVNAARAEAAVTPETLATSRALERVQAGVPFRDAYRAAAQEADAGPLPEVHPDAVRAAYATDGTPGHIRPDRVRAALAGYRAWAEGDDEAA
jgi:argininosuccinate lyase